jgi:peptidoglycan/xylan/chitin deacetylase (PgdA/CDA1 family)
VQSYQWQMPDTMSAISLAGSSNQNQASDAGTARRGADGEVRTLPTEAGSADIEAEMPDSSSLLLAPVGAQSAMGTTLDAACTLLHDAGIFRFIHQHLLSGNISVLMYHGLVADPLPIPDPCFLRVDCFDRQMEYLACNFEVMHLEEALTRGHHRAARPLACVTFDDGFSSVHNLAFPILKRFRIPATVYLVTDLIDSGQTVWFARLHQAICETSAAEIRLGGLHFSLSGQAERVVASAGLQRALKLLDKAEFSPALNDLLVQLGVREADGTVPWEPFRILNSDQIRSMSRDGLVRFGAHTATHQILTRTTPDDVQREIERSVAAVASLVDLPSRSFAYPNGGPGDFNTAVIEVVRRAGIEYALSTIPGPVGSNADFYAIPPLSHWRLFSRAIRRHCSSRASCDPRVK